MEREVRGRGVELRDPELEREENPANITMKRVCQPHSHV